MITAYRITKERFKDNAFSGEGARIGGGRFNSVGVPVVSTASSLPLALLEVLTGLNRYRRLEPYVYFEVSFEERNVTARPQPAARELGRYTCSGGRVCRWR